LEELKKQIFLLCVLLLLLGIAVVFYKADIFWNVGKGIFLHSNSGNCVKINDKICLSEDSGLRTNYYEASSICSKRGMRLPTQDEAWQIWISSENCHRRFAANEILPTNKNAFLGNCSGEICNTFANKINKYCTKDFKIKFPLSSQYKNGSYWLKDKSSENHHYTINYFSGAIGKSNDNDKSFGVRCVK
jgi:hypothetical protein